MGCHECKHPQNCDEQYLAATEPGGTRQFLPDKVVIQGVDIAASLLVLDGLACDGITAPFTPNTDTDGQLTGDFTTGFGTTIPIGAMIELLDAQGDVLGEALVTVVAENTGNTDIDWAPAISAHGTATSARVTP